jgi:Na+-transporting NADH:ubiquinone oxidoreductase subunit NqrD
MPSLPNLDDEESEMFRLVFGLAGQLLAAESRCDASLCRKYDPVRVRMAVQTAMETAEQTALQLEEADK